MRVSKTAFLAIAGWLVAATLGGFLVVRSKASANPRDAVQTLNHVVQCARERDAGFQVNSYDIEIIEVDRGYQVWFKPKGGGRSTSCTFGYEVMVSGDLSGYCLRLDVVAHP